MEIDKAKKQYQLKGLNKTTIIRFRISPEEKEQLKNYCKETNQGISNLIRVFIDKLINNK